MYILILFLLSWNFLPLYAGCCGNCQELHNSSGRPADALLEVLNLYGICHDGSWASIQKQTEQAWLSHGRGKERWEIEPIQETSPEKAYDLFTRLGMVGTISAQRQHYDYGAILGATVQTVRQRFWFLKTEWDRGIRFPALVVLTGDRPLDPHLESEKVLINPASSPYPFRSDWRFEGDLPKNETEMMQLVFDQLALPEEWRHMPVIFVDTPKPEGLNRPYTEHTLLQWLSTNPEPGIVICVSNQPFVCRQDAILCCYLPAFLSMETVGEGFSFERFLQEKRATAIILSELALRIKLYAASISTSSVSFSKAACLCDR